VRCIIGGLSWIDCLLERSSVPLFFAFLIILRALANRIESVGLSGIR